MVFVLTQKFVDNEEGQRCLWLTQEEIDNEWIKCMAPTMYE